MAYNPWGHAMTRRQTQGYTLLAAAAAMLCCCAVSLAQQQNSAPASQANPPAVRPANPNYQPGMLDGIGRWFRDSFNMFGSGVDSARDTIGDLGDRSVNATKNAASATANATADAAKGTVDAAKDAAGAVARLSGTSVVRARERCAIAANGAPDCARAAETMCKAKGFGSGSSLNIESERECPVQTFLQRRAEAGECRVYSYVTSAMCR